MVRRLPAFLLALTVICLCSGPQAADAQDKPEKIKELLEISQMEAILQQLLPVILQQKRASVTKLRPDIPDQVWALVFEEGEAAFRESLGALVEQTIPIYDRALSEAEVDGMLAFYRSEVGRSVVKKLPQITMETMGVSQQWARAVGQETQRRMIAKLRDEGYQI